MALRNPTYLDTDALLAYAEYHDLAVSRQSDIVETASTRRTAGGSVGLSGLGLSGDRGTTVEYQSSYRLEPTARSTASRIIDALTHEGILMVEPKEEQPLSINDLVELEGLTTLTTASMAGKVFYLLRRVMEASDLDLTDLGDVDIDSDPEFASQLKQVYLSNELLPIPLLLEMKDSSLAQRVYLHFDPDNFVGGASVARIEGRVRVLGTVRQLIDGGGEGFLSSEEWLLHDWEHLMKRMLMTRISQEIQNLVNAFELELPADDVKAWLEGPAILVDVVAVY
jgi:hypothetical protein